jgi:hypothetical protein
MELTRLMEIVPLPELMEEDEQQLRRLDLAQIERATREEGFCILGKRADLMPSRSSANLDGRPEEEARRDAAFIFALHLRLATHHLVFRSIPGPDGERVFVAYWEGEPDDDLACTHYIEEWALHLRFQREIENNWDWEQLDAEAVAHGRIRLGRRADLLPVDTDDFVDEQALSAAPIQGVLMLDLIWLETLGEIAGQRRLLVEMERDPQTRENWLHLRPGYRPEHARHGGSELDQPPEREDRL